MIRRAEPNEIVGGRADPYRVQLAASGFAEQLCDGANCARRVASAGKMPEHPVAARFETLLVCGLDKTCDCRFIGGSKKERFVKFPFACELGIADAHSGIVGDLSRAHMMEACDAYATFLGDLVEGSANLGVGLALRDTQVTAIAHRARDLHVEVAVRKEYPAATFGDERVIMPKVTTHRLDLRASAWADEDKGDVAALKLRQSFFCIGEGSVASVDQCAFQSRKDQMTRSEQGRKECNAS